MASNRQVSIESLLPEVAMNYGSSITHKFECLNKEFSLGLDYYFTNFENQVVVDIEDPDEISFYNLDGKSYSHSFQVELGAEVASQLDLKLAYKRKVSLQIMRGPIRLIMLTFIEIKYLDFRYLRVGA